MVGVKIGKLGILVAILAAAIAGEASGQRVSVSKGRQKGGSKRVELVTATGLELRRAELGREVFNDEGFSANGTVSCATCHQAEKGWSDGLPTSQGIFGQLGTRNAPTVLFAAGNDLQFWDGRTIGTNRQALQPLTNPLEMGNTSVGDVMRRMRPKYQAKFLRAYADGFTAATYADAVARFERKVQPQHAAFMKADAGYRFAMSDAATRGYAIFKRDCVACHVPPLLTDRRFHNQGASWATGEQGRDSLGRFAVLDATLRKATDVRAFKTPPLWDVAKSGPYTHNGRVATLEEIVDKYADGWVNAFGQLDPFRDRRAGPFNYNKGERLDLLAFLKEGTKSSAYPLYAER